MFVEAIPPSCNYMRNLNIISILQKDFETQLEEINHKRLQTLLFLAENSSIVNPTVLERSET
jgi:hypothetical protein